MTRIVLVHRLKAMNVITVNYSSLRWIDVEAPTKNDLEKLSIEHNLPAKLLLDCLNPEYLPHIETHGSAHFVVIRTPEPNLPIEADTVQELTTKIAFFITQQGVVTVHRQPLPIIHDLRRQFEEVAPGEKNTALLMSMFLYQVAHSLIAELDILDHKTENFEQNIFLMKRSRSILKDGYYIKRKASSYRKVIKTTMDVVQKLTIKIGCPAQQLQESLDRLSQCVFFAEEIYENVQALLNLHMAIQSQKINEASYKTNETVRILTIFTLFFLPLNFITGVFGMNFEHIPWLKDIHGFYYSILLMAILVICFTLYLAYKGWLQDRSK